jgi:hypothetical protein
MGDVAERDAADEGRLEACGSSIVGQDHREPGQGGAPFAADRECSPDFAGCARANSTITTEAAFLALVFSGVTDMDGSADETKQVVQARVRL